MARRPAPAEGLVPFKRGPGLTTAERSRLMGRVRHSRTVPEEAVAAWLRAHHLRYRRNVRTLPGRPDFANRRAGFAIFVHGCYWHRHPGCVRATTPTRNRDFWVDKFVANVARDAARSSELERAGLLTLTVWECETEDEALLDEKLAPLVGRPKLREDSKAWGGPARARPQLDEGPRGTPSGSSSSVGFARGHRAPARASSKGAGS